MAGSPERRPASRAWSPHFVVPGRVLQGRACCLTFDFRYRMRGFKRDKEQVIRGASQRAFDALARS